MRTAISRVSLLQPERKLIEVTIRSIDSPESRSMERVLQVTDITPLLSIRSRLETEQKPHTDTMRFWGSNPPLGRMDDRSHTMESSDSKWIIWTDMNHLRFSSKRSITRSTTTIINGSILHCVRLRSPSVSTMNSYSEAYGKKKERKHPLSKVWIFCLKE